MDSPKQKTKTEDN